MKCSGRNIHGDREHSPSLRLNNHARGREWSCLAGLGSNTCSVVGSRLKATYSCQHVSGVETKAAYHRLPELVGVVLDQVMEPILSFLNSEG